METQKLATVVIGLGHLGLGCTVMHPTIILATPVIHSVAKFEKSEFKNDKVVFFKNDFANRVKIMAPSPDAAIFSQKQPKVFLKKGNKSTQVYARKQTHFSYLSGICFAVKQNRYPTGFT